MLEETTGAGPVDIDEMEGWSSEEAGEDADGEEEAMNEAGLGDPSPSKNQVETNRGAKRTNADSDERGKRARKRL
jgi:hypothetical protein